MWALILAHIGIILTAVGIFSSCRVEVELRLYFPRLSGLAVYRAHSCRIGWYNCYLTVRVYDVYFFVHTGGF
jgi:hypothetical protein